jgi:hypothetical protein
LGLFFPYALKRKKYVEKMTRIHISFNFSLAIQQKKSGACGENSQRGSPSRRDQVIFIGGIRRGALDSDMNALTKWPFLDGEDYSGEIVELYTLRGLARGFD